MKKKHFLAAVLAFPVLAFPVLAFPIFAHAATLPSYLETRRDFISSEANLLDRNGALLHQLRTNPKERRLSWITVEHISPALKNALIIAEDKQFYAHTGVDWDAVAAAAWDNLKRSKKSRGASTITMQLVGLLDEDLRRKNGARSLSQKWSQAWLAKQLEKEWSKEQILEGYLNLVGFRGELVGVHALSRVLFDKHPSGLNAIESALSVALLRGPNAQPSKVVERACAILKQQQRSNECSALAGLAELSLARTGKGLDRVSNSVAQASPQLAPHLARKLLSKPNQQVRSTLDANLQRFARDALTRQLLALRDRNIEDGAVLVLDNATGDVLAWVGSSGALSAAGEVDGVLALRQPGSTLKPFLYELALEQKLLTAASLLNDAPLNLPTEAGQYIPQNYDRRYKGLVSTRTALASSLNIPAVSTLQLVSPQSFAEQLIQLGLPLKQKGDYYGYSLALGSADVTLLSLTNAYRTLANLGVASAPRTQREQAISAPQRVLDQAASFIISDILSDRSARAPTFGLESALATRMWAAVKTGTSKDMRDNWCIGYSQRYTVGVWVGNASGLPMWDVSGVTGAAPVWHEVLHYLHQSFQPNTFGQKSAARHPPPGVVSQEIRYQENNEAPRTEFFLAGTAQEVIIASHPERSFPSLRYPTPGMLIALDPDIPPSRQRVRIRAQGLQNGKLVLDGKVLPAQVNSKQELSRDWMPWPGKHHLQLLDAKGVVVDQVKFEVRGAVALPKAKPKN